ncbi:Uncharacterised protein [Starkeya nomas]|uniref:Uncharacterized protein n=1 Tax=Starkeya nomas TaxID=2666134 RepID=A0A5S9N7R7_9HYPH|nr:hypothetical protein [Starkeya nomas]CAA0085922.1 Uncharacterised protein [Starkeya nomas]
MMLSVQQIKYELLLYIKEFGGRAQDWRIGVAEDAPQALFGENGVDEAADIWCWKPALTPAAARAVYRYMTEQFHVPPAPSSGQGRCVFLFAKGKQAVAEPVPGG